MKSHIIKGLYKIETEDKSSSVIVSIVNSKDPLKYDYFMLIIDRKGKISIKGIKSPILLARENKLNIQRVSETSTQYHEYIQKITDYQPEPIKPTITKNEGYSLRLRRKEIVKSRA